MTPSVEPGQAEEAQRFRSISTVVTSDRFKHAFKAALAVVIAYAIALDMDWEKPYWAAWTAFSISLATRGEGLDKGLMRLAGGLFGTAGGFLLLSMFIQDRWIFILFLSLHAAVAIYLGMGTRRFNYFWQQAGFFATVVAFDSAFSPSDAFYVGIERAQETGTGLLTYVVIALLLWPKGSRRDVEDTTAKLTAASAICGTSVRISCVKEQRRLSGMVSRIRSPSCKTSWTRCSTRRRSIAGRSGSFVPLGDVSKSRSLI